MLGLSLVVFQNWVLVAGLLALVVQYLALVLTTGLMAAATVIIPSITSIILGGV